MGACCHCMKAELSTCSHCESTRVQEKSPRLNSHWATLPLAWPTDSCRAAVGWLPWHAHAGVADPALT